MANILGTLAVKLDALTANFKKGIEGAVGDLDGFESKVKTVTTGAAAAFAAMAAGIGVVTVALGNQQKAELKLGAAIKGAGQNVDPEVIKSYAKELEKLTGFEDSLTINGAAMLATFQMTEDQIVGMLPRLQNVAVMYDKTLAGAAIAVGKAVTGGAGALTEFGITLSDTQKKAYEAANQTERIAMLMELLDANTGPAAEALSKTAVGAFGFLTTAVINLTQELGNLFDKQLTSVFQSLAGAVNKLTEFISGLNPELKETLGSIGLIATVAVGAVAALGAIALATGPIIAGLTSIMAVAGTVGTALAAAFWPVTIVLVAIAAGIAGTILAVGAMKIAWQRDIGGIREKVQSFIDFHLEGIELLKRGFKGFVRGNIEMFSIMVNALTKAWNAFITAHEDALNVVAGLVGAKVNLGGLKTSGMADIGAEFLKKLDDMFDSAKPKLGKAVKDTVEFLGDAWEAGSKPIFDMFRSTADAAKKELLPSGGAPPIIPTGGKGKPAETAKLEKAKLIEPIEEKAKQAGETLADGFTTAASQIANAAGQGGQTVAIAISAAKSGNWFSAIGTVIANLVTSTESFGQITATLDRAFQYGVDVAEPLVEALAKVMPAFQDFSEAITDVIFGFVWISPIIEALGPILEFVADAISTVASGIVGAWNAMLEGIADVVGWFSKGLAKDIRKGKIDIGSDLTAQAQADVAAAQASMFSSTVQDASESVGDFAETIQQVNDELSNVPEGFKIAMRRFESTAGETGNVFGENSLVHTGPAAGTTNVYVDKVLTNDPSQFIDDMERESEWRNVRSSGTSVPTSGRFMVPQGAGG